MNDYSFGNFLYELREQQQMTQTELGRRLGVTAAAVSKWENGSAKPRVDTLQKLSGIFGISVEELLSGKRIDRETDTDEYNRAIEAKAAYISLFESYNDPGVKVRRGFEYVIDCMLILLISVICTGLYSVLLSHTDAGVEKINVVCMIMLYLIFPFRDILMGGRSLGKRLLGLKIISSETMDVPKLWQLLVRNILVPLMGIECFVALGCGKRIGDMMAKTLVVSGKPALKNPTHIQNPAVNSPKLQKSMVKLIVLISVIAVLFVSFIAATIYIIHSRITGSEAYTTAFNSLTGDSEFIEKHGAGAKPFMSQASVSEDTASFTFRIDGDTYFIQLTKENEKWVISELTE